MTIKPKNAKDRANLERHYNNGKSDATWHRSCRMRDTFDSTREYLAYSEGFDSIASLRKSFTGGAQ